MFGSLKLAKHNDIKHVGFESMTLLVSGTVNKYGYYKKGKIVAQFFNTTIGEAEQMAEYFLSLYEKHSSFELELRRANKEIDILRRQRDLYANDREIGWTELEERIKTCDQEIIAAKESIK